MGIIHYHAGCNQRDFTTGISRSSNVSAQDVRNAVRKHVRETEHSCWIESGSVTHYKTDRDE